MNPDAHTVEGIIVVPEVHAMVTAGSVPDRGNMDARMRGDRLVLYDMAAPAMHRGLVLAAAGMPTRVSPVPTMTAAVPPMTPTVTAMTPTMTAMTPTVPATPVASLREEGITRERSDQKEKRNRDGGGDIAAHETCTSSSKLGEIVPRHKTTVTATPCGHVGACTLTGGHGERYTPAVLRHLFLWLLLIGLTPAGPELGEWAVHFAREGDFVHATDARHMPPPVPQQEHGCSALCHACRCHEPTWPSRSAPSQPQPILVRSAFRADGHRFAAQAIPQPQVPPPIA
ncbi:MAG: hypothetical protein ACREOF_14185 [Gemmatimonadales bacterium]